MSKHTLVKFPAAQFGELTSPTVLASVFSFSVETTDGKPEATLHSRTLCDGGYAHELNGTVYPTVDDARRAGFEAGLIGYYV